LNYLLSIIYYLLSIIIYYYYYYYYYYYNYYYYYFEEKEKMIMFNFNIIGGVESMDWALMLLDMYTRWSKSKGFKGIDLLLSKTKVMWLKTNK
jgi:hypothetical protein